MKELDPNQEREVAFVRTQRTAWVNLSPGKRWLGLAGVVVTLGLLAAVLAAAADGPWLAIGLGMAGVMALLVLPHVLMPERMLRTSARIMPTEDAMKRGDKNMNWPG